MIETGCPLRCLLSGTSSRNSRHWSAMKSGDVQGNWKGVVLRGPRLGDGPTARYLPRLKPHSMAAVKSVFVAAPVCY